MALMFPRLARNFIKNGYFPTDSETLDRLRRFLMPADACAPMRLLDPCCGEGAALAEVAQGLSGRIDGEACIETLGIEFDAERAWHAKTVLTRVIHADVHDVVVKPRSIGLLFLNPPYGFGLKDNVNASAADAGADRAERLERTFLKRTTPTLAPGGVLVYIVPYYALDDEIRTHLARNFTNLKFFMAPEQQFKQCVILGVKVKPSHPRKDVLDMLARAQAGELMDQILPEVWDGQPCEPYEVPPATDGGEFDFHAVRIDGPQLADELAKYASSLLWPGLQGCFNQAKGAHRRPLRDMTKWHLALALAAGQITGRIQSADGRVLLIKGNTFKTKERSVSTQIDEKGKVSETITMLDKFVPVINAIEFTPDHRLGQIVKIS
ncbi:MAG: class I SAM-dependent methyltransferase [Desulfovibrionaceae bacterium]|nr:class I SAM-dependent methyltransferase [Desulfovibrionaceae bacterium]